MPRFNRGGPRGYGRREPPPDDAELFDWALFRDYAGFVLRAPARHVILAIATFVIVFGGAVALARLVPIRWAVSATVMAQRSALMGALSNPGMNREWDNPARGAREVVIRRDNLIALAKRTDFVDRYLASRAPAVRAKDWVVERITGKPRTPEETLDSLVDSLADRLSVDPGPDGTLFFSFNWSNKQLAYDIVDGAVQIFLEERFATETQSVSETIAILQEHDKQLQNEIAAAVTQVETKVREQRGRSLPRRVPVLQPAPAPAAPDDEVGRLQYQLAARRRALEELEGYRRARLAEMQAQLAQQLSVYADGHPTVQNTRQAIESLSQPSVQVAQAREEVTHLEQELIRRGVGREQLPAAVPVDAGGPALADLSSRILASDDPRLELERRRLEELLRQHSNLVQRIDAARVEMDTNRAAFKYRYTVISPPLLPKKPSKNLAGLLVLGGLVGGIGLAFLLAVVADLRRGRVVERWQVERALELPILGELQKLDR